MAIATGIQSKVIIGKETTFGTAATDTVGREMRRVSAELNLEKTTFRSNEIRSDHQLGKTRHGGYMVNGTLGGELSCGTYELPFASLLRGAWTAGVTTGAIATLAAAASGNTITRSAGSFVSNGFKIGDLVNVAGFTAPATANNGRRVIGNLTATVMTLIGPPLVTKAAGDSVTILVPGKKLMVPASGHTDESYTVEKLFEMGATDVSELAVGVKFGGCSIGVNAEGFVTVSFPLMGQDMDKDIAAYFQSPTAATTTQGMTGPQGLIIADGVALGTVTSYSLEITGGYESANVVGSQKTPAIFQGPIGVTGSLDVYFENKDLWQKYKDETDIAVVLYLTAPSGDAFVIKVPLITMTGNTKTDAATGGIIQSIPFEASRYQGAGNYESSTIVFQDSTLV